MSSSPPVFVLPEIYLIFKQSNCSETCLDVGRHATLWLSLLKASPKSIMAVRTVLGSWDFNYIKYIKSCLLVIESENCSFLQLTAYSKFDLLYNVGPSDNLYEWVSLYATL